MPLPILETKRALRRQVGERLGALTPTARAAAAAGARALLQQQQAWQQARSVLFFAPLPGELDVWPLVREAVAAGKAVALPRFDAATGRYLVCAVRDLERDVAPGHWGIREPGAHCAGEPLKRLDLLLVPGVAFDLHGRRLGRGKGYYDQLLAAVSGRRCGVAYDEQFVEAVPVEPHDIRMDCLLTPTRWREL